MIKGASHRAAKSCCSSLSPALAVVRQDMGRQFAVLAQTLLGQRKKREDQNDAPFVVRGAMPQRKVQQREGLSDACRRCQGENAGGQLSGGSALPENLIPQAVQRLVRAGLPPKICHMFIQALEQFGGI